MKKLLLSAVLAVAVSGLAAAQSTSQETSTKQNGPKEEKMTPKHVKSGTTKKGNKKVSGAVAIQDIKLPVPDHTSYAADSSALAPKPKD